MAARRGDVGGLPGPLWARGQFEVDGDADDSGTGANGVMYLKAAQPEGPARLDLRRGELFAVHVSLEAEAVDDRGGESGRAGLRPGPAEAREPCC